MPRRLSRSRNARSDNGWSGTAGSKTARSTLPRSDDALSEVIGFILIIAILMIFLSLWMVYVVPAEGRQQEIEHMNYVRNWFTQYKVTADSLWINHDAEKTLTGVTFSNSLTLGSQGGATQAGGLFLPVMSPIGSTGAVAVANHVVPVGGGTERIEVFIDGDPQYALELGRIEFIATNHYWIRQEYFYQNGGVFVKQQSGTVARIAPLFGIRQVGNNLDIDLTIIQIAGVAQTGISGHGPVRIDTTFRGVTKQVIPSGSTGQIIIRCKDDDDARAWVNILNDIRISSAVSTDYCLINRDPATVVNMYLNPNDLADNVNMNLYAANYSVSIQSVSGVT